MKHTGHRRPALGIGIVTVTVFMAACVGGTEEETRATAEANEIEYLFVQSAEGASLSDGVLRLRGISPTTVYFSDRPERIAGHFTTEACVAWWGEGDDSFAADPPNATLSILSGPEPQEIVVVLKAPRFESGDLVYDVEVLEGKEAAEGDGSSLFIDTAGHPATPHSAAGHHRRVRRRHVRHAGPGG